MSLSYEELIAPHRQLAAKVRQLLLDGNSVKDVSQMAGTTMHHVRMIMNNMPESDRALVEQAQEQARLLPIQQRQAERRQKAIQRQQQEQDDWQRELERRKAIRDERRRQQAVIKQQEADERRQAQAIQKAERQRLRAVREQQRAERALQQRQAAEQRRIDKAARKRQPLPVRFWSRVNQNGPMPTVCHPSYGNCWEWTGRVDYKGYGRMTVKSKHNKHATHVAWFLTYDVWPTGQMAHVCDNPACVRPTHLFEADGAGAANAYDAMMKKKGAILVESPAGPWR